MLGHRVIIIIIDYIRLILILGFLDFNHEFESFEFDNDDGSDSTKELKNEFHKNKLKEENANLNSSKANSSSDKLKRRFSISHASDIFGSFVETRSQAGNHFESSNMTDESSFASRR